MNEHSLQPLPDAFKTTRVKRALPIMHSVIAGKTLAAIAREIGQTVYWVSEEFGWFILAMLVSRCDPYLKWEYPEAFAVRSGMGMPKLVQQHSSLFLDRIGRLEKMIEARDRILSMAPEQVRGIELSRTILFSPYHERLLVNMGIRQLGDLLDRSIYDLDDEGIARADGEMIARFLAKYGLELRAGLRLRATKNCCGDHPIPIHTLLLSNRSQNVLRDSGVEHLDQLTRFTERDLLQIPSLGRLCVNEIKRTLEAHGLNLRSQ